MQTGSRKKILVVDDQPLTQNYLRYALENLGYSNFIS